MGERYPRAELFRVFDVQRISVYEACKRRRRVDHRRLALRQLATLLHVKVAVPQEPGIIGSAAKQGVQVGRFLAGRLMREARLFSSQYRKLAIASRWCSAVAANTQDRHLTVNSPNQVILTVV